MAHICTYATGADIKKITLVQALWRGINTRKVFGITLESASVDFKSISDEINKAQSRDDIQARMKVISSARTDIVQMIHERVFNLTRLHKADQHQDHQVDCRADTHDYCSCQDLDTTSIV